MTRLRVPTVMAVCACWALAACSGDSSPAATDAARAATSFTASVDAQPEAACALLAPQTRQELENSSGPCAQGIKDANLPSAGRVISVDVYGQDAMVRLEHDTLFLARFGSGWRVTAAGCTPQEQDRPFSCELKGA